MRYANNDPQSYRFERKFVISEIGKPEIESLLRFHPAMFSEIFYERVVNNMYLDTCSMTNYYANIDGLQQRTKCRIRWYGDLTGKIEQPVLEFKIKDGLMGRKESFRLCPFVLDERFHIKTVYDVFRKSNIPDTLTKELVSLQPALLNRYTRKYFQSANANYRVTIDSTLQYYRIDPHGNTFLNHYTDGENIVVELKYNHDQDELASKISTLFPFRMTKSSKYVNGIQHLYLG
jgi:hypothetical protein